MNLGWIYGGVDAVTKVNEIAEKCEKINELKEQLNEELKNKAREGLTCCAKERPYIRSYSKVFATYIKMIENGKQLHDIRSESEKNLIEFYDRIGRS